MTTVLYADVLFIINFSMDFLSIYITAKLLSLRQSAIRFTAAAVLGAFGATTMTALGITSFPEALLTVLLSFTMTAIALGVGSLRTFLIRSFALWGAGALLGGAVSVLCSLGESPVIGQHTSGADSPYVIYLASGAILVFFFIRLIRPKLAQKTAEITIRLGENSVTVTALVDSGNLAADPISGSPVIFISRSEAVKLIGEKDVQALLNCDRVTLSYDLLRRLRLIPVAGETHSELYFAIRPDSVTVGKKSSDVFIAVTDKSPDFYSGNPALAPANVI